MPIKGVILVTHNIEEAVQMCDRIMVFSTNPGRIVSVIDNNVPRPRNRQDVAFAELVERIYVEMTAKPGRSIGTLHRPDRPTGIDIFLPHVSTNIISGLIETVAAEPFKGHADLPEIASELSLEIDELFPVAETLQLLHLAEVEGGDLRLTPEGLSFADLAVDERKRLFARHLMAYVPLVGHIKRVLDERTSHMAPKSRFLDELEDHMSPQSAEETLRSVISWARYAELFAYDDTNTSFSLENPT